MALNLIMLGPPGAGKGTQAERFARSRGIPKISTGDILREAVHGGTEIGLRARAIMDRGELVSDDVMIGIVRERLERPDTRGGFVLDGFPRTVAQAEALDRIVGVRGPLIVVDIVVPEAELVRRLSSRMICEDCGANAGLDGPAAEADQVVLPDGDAADDVRAVRAQVEPMRCRRCGGRLVQRSDDNDAVVRERLKIYRRATRPLVEYLPGAPDVPRDRRRAAARSRGGRSGGRDRGGRRRRGGRERRAVVIVCRSAVELERMRDAGRLVGEVLTELAAHVAPGVTTADLDAIAEKRITRAGATPAFKGYHGYPATICASVNDEVIHGIPSAMRVLQEGDVISIDVGAQLDGYFGDSAITLPVGRVTEEAAILLRVTEESLYKAIECVRSGNRISDIGHAVQAHVEAFGFSVVREFVGHGIGQRMHEEPQVPNYGEPGRGPRLAEGMVLAIEPMVNAGRPAVKVMPDGWTAVTRDHSLSAHFEHTVAVTAGEPWILTARAPAAMPAAASAKRDAGASR